MSCPFAPRMCVLLPKKNMRAFSGYLSKFSSSFNPGHTNNQRAMKLNPAVEPGWHVYASSSVVRLQTKSCLRTTLSRLPTGFRCLVAGFYLFNLAIRYFGATRGAFAQPSTYPAGICLMLNSVIVCPSIFLVAQSFSWFHSD